MLPYSDDARRGLKVALAMARELGELLTLEDLVAVLVAIPGSQAQAAVRRVGLDPRDLARELQANRLGAPSDNHSPATGLTILVRDHLRAAGRRARLRRQRRVTTGEILKVLVGLRLVGIGPSLRRLGSSRSRLRRALSREMRTGGLEAEAAFLAPRRGAARFDLTFYPPARFWRVRLRRHYRREAATLFRAETYETCHDFADNCASCRQHRSVTGRPADQQPAPRY